MTTQPHGKTPGGAVSMIGLHRIVAENVRTEMARQLISQVRLAEALGIKQQLVSDRLRGKTPFTINELGIVANVLNVGIADLVTKEKAPRPDPDEGLNPPNVCAARDSNPEPSDSSDGVLYLLPSAA